MGWKKLPTWLKGGIIGLIVYIIVGLNGIIPYNDVLSSIRIIQSVIALVLGLPILLATIFICFKWCSLRDVIVIYSVGLLFYILIGMLVGYIIGKIKSKKKK
ncbi:MAG: hypothetical protein Q7J54_03680 [Candidatus Woesearchaeota archaeon]|nr:hypothetical protein [Candidatus Woesearchaeota archaeon]